LEEYEKNMVENIMQKNVMNGSVPPILEKPKVDSIKKQCEDLRRVFYTGDELTALERDIERMYISEKLDKYENYKKRKSYRYKVKWTTSDFNRYQDQTNYRMNHTEYFGNTKPRFAPFDLDEALRCMYIHQDIEKTSKFRRIFSYFTDVKAFERGQKRSVF